MHSLFKIFLYNSRKVFVQLPIKKSEVVDVRKFLKQKNSFAEQMNCTKVGRAKCVLPIVELGKQFLIEAVQHALYLERKANELFEIEHVC